MSEVKYIPGHAYFCTFSDSLQLLTGKTFLGIYENDYFSLVGAVFLDIRNIKYTPDYFSKIIPVEEEPNGVAEYLRESRMGDNWCNLETYFQLKASEG